MSQILNDVDFEDYTSSGDNTTTSASVRGSGNNSSSTPTKKRYRRNELSQQERKKLHSNQKNRSFVKDWLYEDIFKPWLGEVKEDGNKFLCKICNNITLHLTEGRSALLKHMKSSKHITNAKQRANNQGIKQMFERKTEETLFSEKVQTAEIKLSLFIAEHNIALSIVDDLLATIKDIAEDSKIVKKMQLNRTKCTSVIKNVLCQKETNDLVSVLKENLFSIMIDESTDNSNDKYLCILVRYLCPKSQKVRVQLLEMLKLDNTDCSAEKLYEQFKHSMMDKGIPLSNIIGMSSDGANVMLGENNSFKTRLRLDTKILTVMKCVCHSAALVASKAAKELPRTPEDLIKALASYISGSPKRSAELAEMQEYFCVKQNRILSLGETRWLSRYECVVRILNNWEVLQRYFLTASVEDKLKQSEFILTALSDNLTRAYLFFMKYVLNFFNQFNALFQGRELLVGKLHKESRRLFLKFGQNFLNKTDVNINVFNPRNLLSLDKIYLGPDCEKFLNRLNETFDDETGLKNFRMYCLRFYQVAAQEIQNRLPLNNDLFSEMKLINPADIFSSSKLNIENLKQHFEPLLNNPDEIELELRNLEVHFETDEIEKLKTLEPDEFWKILDSEKNLNGDKIFPNVTQLARLIMLLPHSNAEAERIFSIMNDTKTKKRNRLGHLALNAICVLRSRLQCNNIKSKDYLITKDHMKLMKSANLYSNS